MGTQPVPPENVRIRREDGTEDPVETVYEGVDPEGIHLWYAVDTSPVGNPGDKLFIGMLPPMTAVMVRTREKE